MPASPVPGPTDSLLPVSRAEFGYAQARHLLWRAGFGGTPAQIRLLAEWGPEKSVDHLLAFASAKPSKEPEDESSAFVETIMRPPTEAQRAELRKARRARDEDTLAKFRAEQQRRQGEDRRQMDSMQRWWLKRMIESPRPLQEKLTLFWHGHFATSYRTIENSWHLNLQNRLFRANAAGNFGELLGAIIRDPAMLAYLDNNDSRKEKPNENLARELMELFSLGAGNYTEKDIKEGARALTGYTFEYNEFVFARDRHDAGGKTILGRSGNLDGEGFVRAILDQPACARFIAGKLHRFFVGDAGAPGSPRARATAAVVAQLAALLRESRYELRPVLRRLFLSRHFHDPANELARIKSPAELVVGAVRSLGTPVRDLGILNDAMDLMGQSLFFPPSVKGWDGERSWINTSTLFVRQNLLNFLLTGKTPTGYDPLADTERYDPAALLAPLAESDPGAERDPAKVADYLLRFALGGEPHPDTLAVIERFLASSGPANRDALTGALALITAMPEYQLC